MRPQSGPKRDSTGALLVKKTQQSPRDASRYDSRSRSMPEVGVAESLRTLSGRPVRLLRDAAGVPHFVSPLVLPKRRGRDAVDRLRGYQHPALLPICEAVGSNGQIEQFQEQAMGTPLDRCFAELASGHDPLKYWGVHFRVDTPGAGALALVQSFARLAELAHELLEHDALPPLDPERILISSERGVLLRAGDIIREGIVEGGAYNSRRDLRYCPPELFLASAEASRAFHEEQIVYSIAALLYHCLTGGAPYPGRDTAEIADRVLSGCGPATSRWPTDLPAALCEVLVDALDTEPRRRPATLRAFAALLVAASDGTGKRADVRTARDRWSWRRKWLTRRRLVVAALVLTISVCIFQQSGFRGQRRSAVEERWSTVLELRPIPIATEDPPLHAGAQKLLQQEAELRSWPADSRLHLYRGWAELRGGDLPAARRAFQLALRYRPDFPAARVSLAICRMEQGDDGGRLDRGLLDLGAALATTPGDAEGWFFQGAGFFYLEQFEDAAAAFAQGRDYRGGFLSALHVALCHLYLGDTGRAAAALSEAASVSPGDPWVLWIRAELAAQRGETLEAVACLQRMRRAAPQETSLLLRGGLLLQQLGETEESESWLVEAGGPVRDPRRDAMATAANHLPRRLASGKIHAPQ